MLVCFIWHHPPVGVDSADKSGSGIVTQDEIDALIPENDENRELQKTKKKGVIVGVFVEYILNEIADEEAFCSLFTTLFFILSFFILTIHLLAHHEVYSVQEAIEMDMVNHANFAYVEAATWGAVAGQVNTYFCSDSKLERNFV